MPKDGRTRHNWAMLDPAIIELYATPPPKGSVAAFRALHDLSSFSLGRRRLFLTEAGRITTRADRPWTVAELDILAGSYGRVPIALLATRLHRSPMALFKRAALAGLLRNGAYSLADVAAAIGCAGISTHRWVTRGFLHAVPVSRAQAGSRGTRYSIDDQALHNFFVDYRHLWERFPCPGRDWIDSLIAARDLRRPQDPPVRRQVRPAAPRRIPGIIEYGGPISHRPSARERFR